MYGILCIASDHIVWWSCVGSVIIVPNESIFTTIQVWDVHTLQEIATLSGKYGKHVSLILKAFNYISFLKDKHLRECCNLFLSCNKNHVRICHDVFYPIKPNPSLSAGHVGIVYSLTVLKAPGKMRLFSASYDKTIRVSWKACVTIIL